jgi:hypothetical protein
MKTNAPHLRFFHIESTDVAPLRFKSAMCLSNLFLYKATFTVNNIHLLINISEQVLYPQNLHNPSPLIVKNNFYTKTGICWGWSCKFLGSKSGQKQSVKPLQNMVSSTNPHPFPATHCLITVL